MGKNVPLTWRRAVLMKSTYVMCGVTMITMILKLGQLRKFTGGRVGGGQSLIKRATESGYTSSSMFNINISNSNQNAWLMKCGY